MMELTSKERKILERAAHDVYPSVIVGQGGVTDALSAHVGNALRTHELIKIKFNEFKDDKQNLSRQLAEQNDATVVRVIGNVAILYREQDDPALRQFFIKR